MVGSSWDISVAAKVAGPPSPTRKCVAMIDKYVIGMTLENPKYSKKMLFQWPRDHRV
jgi:hypothetical protein